MPVNGPVVADLTGGRPAMVLAREAVFLSALAIHQKVQKVRAVVCQLVPAPVSGTGTNKATTTLASGRQSGLDAIALVVLRPSLWHLRVNRPHVLSTEGCEQNLIDVIAIDGFLSKR